ncbi:DinB family protein [Alkalihalobacillus sp. TS-13]|uniref:DinB family protein n=1 Tax=Alkalihalobacillus sp. TS-13 TaxID=2842455 RepID=UPI001C86B54E|nr:DinB family protein [Alkalihalobacillus sp. TS-13]
MTNPVEMYHYHSWANQVIFNRLKEFPEEIFYQEVQGTFPSISKVLAHIYTTDRGWLEILSGIDMSVSMEKSGEVEEEASSRTLEELEKMFIELSQRYKSFLEMEMYLDRKIVLDNPYAGVRDTKVSEIVLHVVNHGTYHRGNVSSMLHQMGYSLTMNDYALFWYQVKSSNSSNGKKEANKNG